MTSLARVVIKPRRARPFFARHPWVFVTSIGRVEGDPQAGDEVEVYSHENQFIGRGVFNPHSAIRVRLYRWDGGPLDEAFWDASLADALRLRREVLRLEGPTAGYRVVSSDVEPQRADVLRRDFLLEQEMPVGCQSIITNPPFRIAGDFVRHALGLGVRKLAIIQRIAFLEGSERRKSIFGPHPPARVWVFSRRVTMWKGDLEEQRDKGGAMAFAWICWEVGQPGTQLGWID